LAGRIQQSGRFAMLVPRELGLSIMSASIPLPPVKPAPLLASYSSRPASLPAKPEPSQNSARTVHPGTVYPVEPLTRRQPSMVAARTFGFSEPPSPPIKPKSSQDAARAVPVKKPASSDVAARGSQPSALAPAKTGKSQATARTRLPEASPVVTKPELSEVGARTLQSAARVPGNSGKPQVATRPRQPASNLVTQEARHRSPR
jgi:hypothetical protein